MRSRQVRSYVGLNINPRTIALVRGWVGLSGMKYANKSKMERTCACTGSKLSAASCLSIKGRVTPEEMFFVYKLGLVSKSNAGGTAAIFCFFQAPETI